MGEFGGGPCACQHGGVLEETGTTVAGAGMQELAADAFVHPHALGVRVRHAVIYPVLRQFQHWTPNPGHLWITRFVQKNA